MFKQKLLSIALLAAGLTLPPASALKAKEGPKSDTAAVERAEVISQMLPKGDYRKVSSITVAYAPGGESPKHRHDVAVFAYVLQGAVESQLQGEAVKTFKAGQMWYEPPGTVHLVSRNASDSEPAKLLVFAVEEEGKRPTTVIK